MYIRLFLICETVITTKGRDNKDRYLRSFLSGGFDGFWIIFIESWLSIAMYPAVHHTEQSILYKTAGYGNIKEKVQEKEKEKEYDGNRKYFSKTHYRRRTPRIL